MGTFDDNVCMQSVGSECFDDFHAGMAYMMVYGVYIRHPLYTLDMHTDKDR